GARPRVSPGRHASVLHRLHGRQPARRGPVRVHVVRAVAARVPAGEQVTDIDADLAALKAELARARAEGYAAAERDVVAHLYAEWRRSKEAGDIEEYQDGIH